MHLVCERGRPVHLQPGRFAEHDARSARRTLEEDRVLVSLALLHLVPVLEASVIYRPIEGACTTTAPLKSTGVIRQRTIMTFLSARLMNRS